MPIQDEAREHFGKIVPIPDDGVNIAPNIYKWETKETRYFLYSNPSQLSFDSLYRNDYEYIEGGKTEYLVVAINKRGEQCQTM